MGREEPPPTARVYAFLGDLARLCDKWKIGVRGEMENGDLQLGPWTNGEWFTLDGDIVVDARFGWVGFAERRKAGSK